MDVEGTTTAKDFVFQVLFPFSTKKMSSFLQSNYRKDSMSSLLSQLSKEQQWAIHSQDELIKKSLEVLLQWIGEDKKHPILKSIQGMIWEEGYLSGELQSHVYDDIPGCFQKWSILEKVLAIYSSGSVLAQKLLFKYCEKGDLTKYLSAYFDTSVGHKREASSYLSIAKSLNVLPSEILFLSDVEEELSAAKSARMGVVLINRDHSKSSGEYLEVTDFCKI